MRRLDYMNTSAGYPAGEGRHTLSIRGSSNVLVAGLTLTNAGGDGVYISDGDDLLHDFASNITLLDLNSSFNYRQGLSVISVVGLNVSHCLFAHTGVGGGPPPMAGIDLEPGGHTGWHTEHRLSGITIADSASVSNLGDGISIGLTGLINATWPVGIAVRNYSVYNSSCWGAASRGRFRPASAAETATCGAGFLLGGGSQLFGADGSISFTDCVVDTTMGPGFSMYSKGSSRLFVNFHNVSWRGTAINATTAGHPTAPILLICDSTAPSGGLHFSGGCAVHEDQSRPWLTTWPCHERNQALCGSVANVTGAIDVYNPAPAGCTTGLKQTIELAATCHGKMVTAPPATNCSATCTCTFGPTAGPYQCGIPLSKTLPNIMLLSDSIGAMPMGYYTNVVALFGNSSSNSTGAGAVGNAVVHHTGNMGKKICGTSFGPAACIDFWFSGGGTSPANKYDVIHFNWGLHDIDANAYAYVSPGQYAANMEEIYLKMKRWLIAGGSMIWSTNTPVPPSYRGRKNVDVLRINTQMAALFGPTGKYKDVFVSDMYGAVVKRCNNRPNPNGTYPEHHDCDVIQSNGVHMSAAGRQYTALVAAGAIAAEL